METYRTEPMMDHCEFFDNEEEAIVACREVDRGLNSKDPACWQGKGDILLFPPKQHRRTRNSTK